MQKFSKIRMNIIALSTEWRKEENGKILFEKPNVSPKIFEFILKYLYSGDIISLNNFNYSEFTDIIIAADEFILHDLVSYIEQKLLMSYNNWSKKCFVQIYKCVLEQEFCKELQTFFEERINEKPSIILESEDFTLLDEEMIIRFLRLEDHYLLWKYINNDEPKPHSSDTTKVKSYSDVAAQNIQNIQNIWNTPNIRQNSSIQIDSDIIGNNHAALISRWIRRTMNKSCLGFNLIMNSSIDGFSSQIFNRKCDEIRPTLVILTVEGTNEILGGFNPLRWGSRGECWKDTRDSFIFSFPDGQDHTNHRYSRVNPVCEKKAIYRSGSNGPNFGGGDLTLGRQTSLKRDCICVQTNYLVPIRDDFDYFRASSYEIFEVLI
ncbi:unnamed protein product [Rhizophagus irregularis]|nr:unnamed protein product [Rhizophagus irregularis]